MLFTFIMLVTCALLWQSGQMGPDGVLICTVAMTSSFGPVTALSNLANNLNQTLAAGERVISILEEEPKVYDVLNRERKGDGDPRQKRMRQIHSAQAHYEILGS